MHKTIEKLNLSDAQRTEMETLEKRFVGKRVVIVARDHPYSTEAGTVDRMEYVGVVKKVGFVVKYDCGLDGFIFNASDWRVLS